MTSTKSDLLIPPNYAGNQADVEHQVTLDTKEEAVTLFKKACGKMFNVNMWHKFSGFASSNFRLINEQGNEVDKRPEVGDYIQIDVPGPGASLGDGYDWVQVELIDDHSDPDGDEESMGFRVRPAKNPNTAEETIAHFFTREACSVFIIQRKQNTVTSCYHGRNEVMNTEIENLPDRIRNRLVASGDYLGIGNLQWSTLIKGFIEKHD